MENTNNIMEVNTNEVMDVAESVAPKNHDFLKGSILGVGATVGIYGAIKVGGMIFKKVKAKAAKKEAKPEPETVTAEVVEEEETK